MNKEYEFDCEINESITINKKKSIVYQALYNIKEWPKYLPHVTKIDVLYNDGKYQEFMMDVISSEDASILQVRSIRNCTSSNIDFFQPQPPHFLKHHSGNWKFKEVDKNQTHVVTTHKWNLKEINKGDVYAQHVKSILRDHACLALKTWKDVLESM